MFAFGSKVVRVTWTIAFGLALLLAPSAPVRADNAPVWQTEGGLGPGVKSTTVRMAGEQVDVRVVEHDNAAVAIVNATFNMLNNGPTLQLLTGFPNEIYGTIADNGQNPDLVQGVYDLTANITDFRAWTDDAEYRPTQQPVTVGQFANEKWFVWNMTYPQGKTLPVHVSYRQTLGQQMPAYCDACPATEYVNVIYVLRTGALWAGTIDNAHITFEASDGGGFAAADSVATLAGDHVVWDFTNFKPSSDVGAVYVFATPWKELQAAEAAAGQPSAGPTEFLRAAQDALLVLGANAPQVDGGVPTILLKRYGNEIRQWAGNASILNTADAWKALGDADVLTDGAVHGSKGAVTCWPEDAVNAYQYAADLGSDAAAQNLAYLHAGGLEGPADEDVEGQVPSCGQ